MPRKSRKILVREHERQVNRRERPKQQPKPKPQVTLAERFRGTARGR